jgi:large subunit ribosomal protein L29
MKELRAMSEEDLNKKLTEIGTDLMHERGISSMGGAPPNPGKLRALKKDIARILTVINEKNKEVKNKK